MTGTALVDLDGDTATGTQPLCFIEHSRHDMRIGYYRDTYVRTADGLAAEDQSHDIHPAKRRPRPRDGRTRSADRLHERRRVPVEPVVRGSTRTT